MRQLVLIFLLSAFAGISVPAIIAQPKTIQTIEIVSAHTGMEVRHGRSRMTIRKQGDRYLGDKPIDKKLIEDLAFQIQYKGKIELADFGITPEWLEKNIDKALERKLTPLTGSPRALLRKSFLDINKVKEIFPKILRGGWTDDFPKLTVTIQYSDNSLLKVTSDAQGQFMLPMEISSGESVYYSANPKLSLAIARLMPSKFLNRERIAGDHLALLLGNEVYDSISDELDRLKVNDLIGTEIARLGERYKTLETAINKRSSIDAGHPGYILQSEEEKRKWNYPSWNAKFQRTDLPSNLTIGVSLPYRNGKLDTFDIFISKIDRLAERMLSVPWLANAIKESPETEFEMRFVENRSLSPKAEATFFQDLEKFGPNALDPVTRKEIGNSIFLMVTESKSSRWSLWLILPDNRMILWYVKGNSVLRWKPTDFETRILHDVPDWFHAKAVISPTGEIESR